MVRYSIFIRSNERVIIIHYSRSRLFEIIFTQLNLIFILNSEPGNFHSIIKIITPLNILVLLEINVRLRLLVVRSAFSHFQFDEMI